MNILVLGGGVVGVTTAWYLRQAGHAVSLVEREAAPAMGASFANGGQISVSHPEPWANPATPGLALRWLGRKDAPLLWHWRADIKQLRWGLDFLRQCCPGNTRQNTAATAELGLESLSALNRLQAELNLDFAYSNAGILHLFKTPALWAQATYRQKSLQEFGIPAQVLDVDACIEKEPALAHCAQELKGGLLAPNDVFGDAHLFTQALAQRAQQAGVNMQFNTTVVRLAQQADRITGAWVQQTGQSEPVCMEADYTVVCLGEQAPFILEKVGISSQIYPVKGYSITAPIIDPVHTPKVSLIDEALRIVCSPLENRLRIAGTAEFNGHDYSISAARTEILLAWGRAHFGEAVDFSAATPWSGLRPMRPSGLPQIGYSARPGLVLNTGHGSLGWTLACGSAQRLVQILLKPPSGQVSA